MSHLQANCDQVGMKSKSILMNQPEIITENAQ